MIEISNSFIKHFNINQFVTQFANKSRAILQIRHINVIVYLVKNS